MKEMAISFRYQRLFNEDQRLFGYINDSSTYINDSRMVINDFVSSPSNLRPYPQFREIHVAKMLELNILQVLGEWDSPLF